MQEYQLAFLNALRVKELGQHKMISSNSNVDEDDVQIAGLAQKQEMTTNSAFVKTPGRRGRGRGRGKR